MKKMQLHKKDLVSLQSLSSGMAGDKDFLHKFEIGRSRVEQIGLQTIVSKHALKGSKYLATNPQKRAEDLMNAFNDEKVKMIIANIGGFDSHQLIPYLDKQKIKTNPKPILGYSDITSLHLFLYTLGIQTYYGPSVLDGFAENVQMHKLTLASVKNVMFKNKPQKLVMAKKWTSEFLDWANPAFNQIKRKMLKETHGQIWLNFKENISGPLIGGCLDTIVRIKKEPFFPKLTLWKDAILFLETSEQKMSPQDFKKAVQILKAEIKACKGIIFGKPKDEKFFWQYLDIIKQEVKKPIIFNVNFGHTAPIYTIPYGGIAQVNINKKTIIISK